LEKIPVFLPAIGKETLKHIEETLNIGWLGMGATTEEFEKLIAEYFHLDDRYVIATNTATSALHLALRAAKIGPGILL